MPTYVQSGSAASNAVTLGSAVTAGNLVVLVCTRSGSGNTATCSDDLGNTYSQIGGVYDDGGNSQCCVVFYAVVTSGGTPTITVAWTNGGAFNGIVAAEYSGCATSSPLDASNVNTSPATSTSGTDGLVSTAVVPSVDGCLILGFAAETSGAVSAYTAGTNFSERVDNNAGGVPLQIEDLTQGTAASISATWTTGVTGGAFLEAVAAFKPAGGAGAQTILFPMMR